MQARRARISTRRKLSTAESDDPIGGLSLVIKVSTGDQKMLVPSATLAEQKLPCSPIKTILTPAKGCHCFLKRCTWWNDSFTEEIDITNEMHCIRSTPCGVEEETEKGKLKERRMTRLCLFHIT